MQKFRQRRVGAFLETHVAEELGVVLERCQVDRKTLARRCIRRRTLKCGQSGGQRALQIGHCALKRILLCCRSGGRDPQTLRQERLDQPVTVGPLLLDRLDVEAEPGERLGEQLQVFVLDRSIRVDVFVDLLLTEREQLLGPIQAKHLERTRDLLAVMGEGCQLGTLGVIAEKSVEHLLEMTQVGLDFARDLRQEQPLLRATRHFVEEWRRHGAGDRLVLLGSVEPRNHRLDLLREIG